MKQATLCFLVRDNQVLLAMKKRGFGAGKWNGVGGKVNDTESVVEAMVRETFEEIAVKLNSWEQIATLNYQWPESEHGGMVVSVFLCKNWDGDPNETEEMKPQWFDIDKIPFDQMWVDDIYWLPKVLSGQRLSGQFVFDKDQKMISYNLQT